LSITDERMTRFWITLRQGVDFVLDCLERMRGNEVFIPKIPSMKLVDLARAIAPACTLRYNGIRPGEKLHEVMIDENDSRITMEYDKYFVIGWSGHHGNHGNHVSHGNHGNTKGQPCPPGFSYRSDTNADWLSVEKIREYVREFLAEHPEYQYEPKPEYEDEREEYEYKGHEYKEHGYKNREYKKHEPGYDSLRPTMAR